jgi:hypothetical protein
MRRPPSLPRAAGRRLTHVHAEAEHHVSASEADDLRAHPLVTDLLCEAFELLPQLLRQALTLDVLHPLPDTDHLR